MQRFLAPICRVVSAVALVALIAVPSLRAQQTAQDMVAFKATVSGPIVAPSFIVPGNPTIAVHNQKLKGTADFMGAVDWVDLHPVHVSDDGKPLGQPYGQGAMIAANGDALYFTWSGPAWATETGAACLHVFSVTGGKGRFKGVTGYGLLRGMGDVTKGTVNVTVEATITRPATAQ